MQFHEWLQAKGIDPDGLTEPTKLALQAAWRAEQSPAPGPAPKKDAKGNVVEDETPAPAATADQTLENILAAARTEQERKNAVTELVAKYLNAAPDQINAIEQIGRLAIEGKWDLQKTELQLLRTSRGTGPTVYTPATPQVTPKVLEAAICKAGGLQDADKQYPEQVLEAADKQFRRGLGLGRLVAYYAQQNGWRGQDIREDLGGALRAAFYGAPGTPQPMAAAWGPSTGGGLSGVLSNVANKFLRDGFNYVEGTWREVSSRRSVSDFKQISTYSLTGGLTYEKVAPGGEIKHGTLGAETYTNQVDTRGKMIGIDRRDLINDDLNALTGVGRKLGRGAATTLNKDFWTVFLNNSSFFTSGRGNVSTGAGSALAVAGLDAAMQKFLLMTDPDGNLMGVMPRILLAPPALSYTADQLMSSSLLVSGNTTAAPNANVWAGKFRSLTSAYMQDSTLTGNSSAAWYLLADPNDVPVIEVAFLNGMETPTVETADADFNMLGIAMRAYLDYGIAFQEYRGGVRSAGS
jgi:hypothetical protein